MKFTYHALTECLDSTASIADIATALTDLGLEIEEVRHLGAGLEPFTVAHIMETTPHPDAEKLRICRVATHQGERQIVCGAPNARANLKVALADMGAVIPQNGMVIKPAKIRGVESQGMLCSAYELGLGEGHEGIIELPEDASIGAPLIDVLQLNDTVFAIAITPNRGDCLSVYGIARDLAAKGLGTLRPLPLHVIALQNLPTSGMLTLHSADCSHFTLTYITGVKNGESPAWLKRALQAIGQKPISALVDITNYFSLVYGRPLHVYDADKLQGALCVRPAKAGELFHALNEKEYVLPEGACVIADAKSVQAIGGIMGGALSGCSADTTTIYVESAWFDPRAIATVGRALQIDSDARYRFERSVDPQSTVPYAAMAVAMIQQLCGGECVTYDEVGAPYDTTHVIPFEEEYIRRRLGIAIPLAAQQHYLTLLGCQIVDGKVVTPSWRPDLATMADLSEEVARLYGYAALPATPLPPFPVALPLVTREDKARAAMQQRGLHEVVHFAFTSEEHAQHFKSDAELITLCNPISSELTTMRPHLYADMLQAVRHNMDRGITQLALGQVGQVFFGVTPDAQKLQAAGVRLGASAQHWQGSTPYDVFSAKADLYAVLSQCGVNVDAVMLSREVPAWYHPTKAGRISLGHKNTLGYFGELHPAILRHYGIEERVYGFECWLEQAPAEKQKRPTAYVRCEFQASRRDFAFVVDAALPAHELQQALVKAGGKEVKSVVLFDVYQGAHMEQGKKSLAFAVTIQAENRTLQEQEIQQISEALLNAARQKGAVLR